MSSRAWWYLVGFATGIVFELAVVIAARTYPAMWLVVIVLLLLAMGMATLAAREDRQAASEDGKEA